MAEYDRDYYKDEALRMLIAPLEALGHLFAESFLARGFHTTPVNSDWAKGTLTIEFPTKSPTSDQIRDTIFTLYDTQWAGKPKGIDVVFNRALAHHGDNKWTYAYPSRGDGNCGTGLYHGEPPLRLFITSDQALLSDLGHCTVLNNKDFKDWKASKIHHLHKRARFKESIAYDALVNSGIAMTERERVVDPGEHVPVFKFGLFKL